MAGIRDIKDFTKFPSLSDDDLLLGSKTSLGGTDASITVANFKKQVAQDVEPSINENGYWVVNGVNTGKKAEGSTPILEGGFTTTGEPGSQASSSIVRSGETPEGLPRYIINLTIPRGITGNDGKTSQFKIGTVENGNDASASISFDGEDEAGNPVYKINLVLPKGEIGNPGIDGTDGIDGKTPKFEAGAVTTLDPGEPATAQITFKQNDTDGSPIYTISLSIPKGDTGDSGKTPILESVSAISGETPSGSFSQAGVDESGNPKYILNLTLPKGKDGQPAVFEAGTTTTLAPSAEASVEVVPNGETPNGNPKYILNFFIPRGETGLPGAGSGNVSADGTGLLIGKKYLFVPSANGTTTGTFVEYVAPTIPEQVQPDWNATAGKAAILNKPTIPSKTSQLSNDSNFATKTDIGNHNTSAVAHSDIRQALSDVEAIARGKSRAKVFDTVAALDVWLGVSANVTTLQVGDNFYIKALDVPDYWWDGTAKQPIEAEKVDLTNYVQKEAGKGLFSGSYNDLSNKPTIPTVPGVATSTVDGLMSSADKRNLDAAVVPKNITTATTLTNLSIANYSIKVTLSSASALSFASTPAEGWECMIDIKNVEGGGSGPITQPLPNASGWQCDETSLTIAQGKIASISVRYIHGTYVVIAKGN